MLFTAEFWVVIAFGLLVCTLVYLGVHRRILNALDQRSASIKATFDEAHRLKKEADLVFGESQRRLNEAGQEAEVIIFSAHAEAKRLAAEAKQKAEDLITRRTKHAEARIAQAEKQALADVKAVAAETAVTAAGELLTNLDRAVANQLFARDIKTLRAKLRNETL